MRNCLKENTWIQLPDGECYVITGAPIGEGGGSLIYPAAKLIYTNDHQYKISELNYALKECYPVSSEYLFIRTDSGEIMPQTISPESISYLNTVQNMQMQEQSVTGTIFNTGFRLTPILSGSFNVKLSYDNGLTFIPVHNAITVMESLSSKGRSLKSYLSEKERLTLIQAFRVIEQVLFSVREIHQAGYLHLDIQDGNVFIKGSLTDCSDLASLIDFGSSRRRLEDGKCKAIEDRVIFSTHGFAAPEICNKNDGTLRLGPEADIYSIGYLLLLLITGQKYKPYEVYSNKDGHYLTKFRLKKIHCPRHLVERMQQILAKALENDPVMRYRSCDAMLADVSDFLKALQPYRTDLSQVAYDAFICYKHGPVDSAAALALQKYLEHFHIPGDLRKNKKRIQRVFVDEGELSSCSDFGLEIREALKNAGFLIVICSPETKNSPWVNLEINTFLEFHDRSRILAVMTEGEPTDIFPEPLLGRQDGSAEVLAADARGKDLRTVLKNLKKNALLRIAAPILGTTYDSLKQRHRIYAIQRIAALSAASFLILLAFTLQTLWQSSQVRQQYQQAQKNQARYLSSISQELLLNGDKDKALLTALAVKPENDALGPVVPEQMYALNNALSSYKDGMFIRYDPLYTGEADGITFGILSPDNTYYYAIDQRGNAVALSAETGKLQWTITPETIRRSIDDLYPYYQEYFQSIRLILPVSEQEIALALEYCIAIVDPKSGNVIHTFPLDARIVLNYESYSQEDDLFVYTSDDNSLYAYNLNTGEKIDCIYLNQDSFDTGINYTIQNVALNKSKNTIALALSYTFSQDMDTSAAEPSGLLLYSLDDKTSTVISTVPTRKVLFADDTHIAAIHISSPVSGAQQKDIWGAENLSCFQALYELPSNRLLYQGGYVTVLSAWGTGLTTEHIQIREDTFHALITWIRGNLVIVDISSGKVLIEQTYRPDIIGVSEYDHEHLFISLRNGSVQSLITGERINSKEILTLTTEFSKFSFNQTDNTMILLSDDRRLLFCGNLADSEMNLLKTSDLNSPSMQIDHHSSGYIDLAGNAFRYLCLYENSSFNITEILVFPVHSKEYCFCYKSPGIDYSINNIGFGFYRDSVFLSFTEASPDQKITFRKLNISTGEQIICEDVTPYSTLQFAYSSEILYSSDMNTMYVKRSKGVAEIDISGHKLLPTCRTFMGHQSVEKMCLTGDEQYLVLFIQNQYGNKHAIYACDLNTESFTELQTDDDYSSVNMLLISGRMSSQVCFYDGKKHIYVADCNDCSKVTVIDLLENSKCLAAFFDSDQYLIIATDNIITLYDLKNKKPAHTYTCSEPGFTKIITDSSNKYFALKNYSVSGNYSDDPGTNRMPLYIFYADEMHTFYPYAKIDYGNACLSGAEVCTTSSDYFSFSRFYNYTDLKEKALSILNGKTLTAEEELEYFVETPR